MENMKKLKWLIPGLNVYLVFKTENSKFNRFFDSNGILFNIVFLADVAISSFSGGYVVGHLIRLLINLFQ